MKYEKSCGAVVYIKTEGKFEFLAVRSKVHGHWGFPKGHVETGETEQQTALRETLEETGLIVTLIDGFRFKTEYRPFENVHKEVIFFAAEPVNHTVKIQDAEVKEYKWAGYEDLLVLLTYENDRNVLREAFGFLCGKA